MFCNTIVSNILRLLQSFKIINPSFSHEWFLELSKVKLVNYVLVLEKLKFCANLGCKNKTGKGFSSFCIPKDTESEQQLEKKRRLLWIKKLKNRIDITDHINFRVCMIIRYYCLPRQNILSWTRLLPVIPRLVNATLIHLERKHLRL